MSKHVVTIIKDLQPQLEKKIESYRKKLQKWGTVEYTTVAEYVVTKQESKNYGYKVVDIEIQAEYKLSDYKLVAALEYINETKTNIITTIDKNISNVPDMYRDRNICDHCKTNRNRKYTLLLQHINTGEFIQVGKSCVKDFLGVDLGNYAMFLSMFDTVDEYVKLCERQKPYYVRPMVRVDDVLTQAFCDVEYTKHYISSKEASDRGTDSTPTRVSLIVHNVRNHNTGKVIINRYEPCESHVKQVAYLKSFYSDLEDVGNYEHNIKALLKLEWVEDKHLALLVSSLYKYIKETNLNYKKKIIQPISEFVGAVGDKITITSIPECVYATDTAYGYYYIYKIVFNNNVFTWKTSKTLPEDQVLTITGTIKQHVEYRGVKQTELTRCRITL